MLGHGLWLTCLMGEQRESDRRVSERSSLFMDVAEPKQLCRIGSALIRNIKKIKSLKTVIGVELPSSLFLTGKRPRNCFLEYSGQQALLGGER